MLRVLSRADVDRALPMAAAIAAVEQAYVELSAGRVQMPVRLQVPVAEHGGRSIFMTAYAPAFAYTAVKAVSVYPENRARHGLPAILGAVLALDSHTGRPAALLEASLLTARRTGAATGVACRHLARPGAAVAAVIGAGGQAREQVSAVLAATAVLEVRLASRSGTSAQALAAALTAAALRNSAGEPVQFVAAPDAAAAVAGADIVVTATTAHTPVFPGAALAPGALVCGIGSFTPAMQEVGPDALLRCDKIIVDHREAAPHEAGDLCQAVAQGALTWAAIYGEIGEIVAGQRPGREQDREILYFKSVGLAIQDAAVAAAALAGAERLGLGSSVPF